MKNKKLVILGIIVAALALGISGKILAEPPRPEGEIEVDVQEETAVADTVRNGFSYQGHLTDKTGNPLDGQYDMVFQFWDASTVGSQVGNDITVIGVDVSDGLFNITVDTPDGLFDGTALWLRVKVGDEWLEQRREILPVPYALSLRPEASVYGSTPLGDYVFAAINQGDGYGVAGKTESGDTTYSAAGVYGYSVYTNTFGVLGESNYGIGVEGRITDLDNTNAAVVGYNTGGGDGIYGRSNAGYGVRGKTYSDTAYSAAGVWGYSFYTNTFGVLGESDYGIGVEGRITDPDNTNAAVVGYNTGGGDGVYGWSNAGYGVRGKTYSDTAYSAAGVWGFSFYTSTFGVLGESEWGIGVEGRITNPDNTRSAVIGYNTGGGKGVAGYSDNGYGVYGEGATYGVAAVGGMLAPTFDVGSPDVAEYFPTTIHGLEPGDVVVIDLDANGKFGLRRAAQAYDTTVAGIVSTEPGITLGVRDGDIIPGDNEDEVPLALVGRVPCKVDASYGAIAVGDLLTTSPTSGHAMRCDDHLACIGSIVGKALQPLEDGTGVILVLVTLQ